MSKLTTGCKEHNINADEYQKLVHSACTELIDILKSKYSLPEGGFCHEMIKDIFAQLVIYHYKELKNIHSLDFVMVDFSDWTIKLADHAFNSLVKGAHG